MLVSKKIFKHAIMSAYLDVFDISASAGTSKGTGHWHANSFKRDLLKEKANDTTSRRKREEERERREIEDSKAPGVILASVILVLALCKVSFQRGSSRSNRKGREEQNRRRKQQKETNASKVGFLSV